MELELFVTRLLQGLSNGAVYGFLALAMVCTYRGSRALNLAQGELAMLCTFVAWSVVQMGAPILVAIAAGALFGAVAAGLFERVLIRPLGHDDEYPVLIICIGVFLAINAGAGVIWGGDPVTFPSLVPTTPDSYVSIFGARLRYQQLLIMVVLALVLAGLYAIFKYTRLGLAMRAAASNPESASLLGIRVSRMNSLGWIFAGVVGALLGPLLAPATTLSTAMFINLIVYACAAATLGGFDSPVGAVLGGLIIGVAEALVSSYVPFIGDSLKLTVALVILLAVLMIKPSGLLGSREVARV